MMHQIPQPATILLILLIAVSPLQLRALTCDREGVPLTGNLPGSGPSENCTQTLSSLLRNVTSHSTIRLERDNYIIDEFILIQDVINITMETTGNSNEPVLIQCQEDPSVISAGLAFVNVTDLSIHNIVIDGCGFTGRDINNTVGRLREIVNIFYVVPSSVRISLLLGHCENVLMEQVSIINTKGFGLVSINVVGTSELISVNFFNNTNPGECNPSRNVFNPSPSELTNYDSLGGGAVFIYFDYLSSQTRYQGSRSNLNLQNCNFTLNSECSLIYLNLLRSPGRGESSIVTNSGYSVGGSGALALALTQLEYGVTVTVASSVFYNNEATFGSGSTIAMFKETNNTHVVFVNCTFDKSAVAFFNDIRQPTNGINFDNTPNSFNRNITFSVLNSNFTNAVEVFAGSTLLIYSNYYSEIVSNSVNVFVDKCNFINNRATVGSAMAVYEYKINGFGQGMQLSIKNSHFVENKVITENHNTMVAVSQSASTVHIRNMNITLYGNCSFVDNIGTGLKAESSVIGINGNITFLRNTGVNGGALSLVTYSYLIMNKNSSIFFTQNEARIAGGAIYVNENGIVIGGYVDCFIHFAYDNFIVCDNCSDLNSYGVYIKFLGNVAAYTGSMVSGSSLATCPWVQQLREKDKSNRSVFEILAEDYPSVFSFDQPPNNSMVVQSTAAELSIDYNYTDDGLNVAEVFPGQQFNLNISALDDFNQIISNVVTAFATTTDDSANNGSSLRPLLGSTNFAVLETNHSTGIPVTILGSENQNISLVIYSTDSSARAQLQLNITLLKCGFGFKFHSSNSSCACDPRLLDTEDGVFCDSETHTLTVDDGAWIGLFRGDIIVDRCLLFGYCRAGQTRITVDSDDVEEIDFDVQCDPGSNRVGLLCGECMENLSAVLGTRNCKLCTNWYLFLLIFFIAIGIVAIMVIQYLNITITAGYINGAIFYSNIISIYGPTIVPGNIYNKALVLVSFPSLSLGIETCFYNGMTIFHRVLWQLSFPIYLFLLMAIVTLLSGTKCWKRFLPAFLNQSGGSITIRSFATLLIVCYLSVLGACSELIAFNRIYRIDRTFFLQWRSQPSLKYFGKEHCLPGILAFLILIFYIIPFPLFLLFPSILYRNRYTSRYKPIFDTFWDPYKPQYRYFLGFRLIFLILPFFLATTVRPPLSLFVVNFFLILYLLVHCLLQPYQEKWRNYIDAAFVCNLVLILSGSIYFWSEYNNSELEERRDKITLASRIYTNIFIVFGFVLILGIIVYHVILRFPAKTKKIQKVIFKRKSLKKTDDDEALEEENEHTNGADNGTQEESFTYNSESQVVDRNGATERGITSPKMTLLPPVRTVELREPLLESGSLSYREVDPSFVPRAVQDFISDLRH